MTLPDRPMADRRFAELRSELLKTSAQLSCHQMLDLADLFHTVIRMRKPHRPLKNVHDLFRDEAAPENDDAVERPRPARRAS